jgi:hypothetical protein
MTSIWDLGPNNLRALAHYGTLSDSDRKRLSDCADAWGADVCDKNLYRADRDAEQHLRVKAEADNAALRERLEQTIKALRNLGGYGADIGDRHIVKEADAAMRAAQPDGTITGATADQRDQGPCWAGGNIAGE